MDGLPINPLRISAQRCRTKQSAWRQKRHVPSTLHIVKLDELRQERAKVRRIGRGRDAVVGITGPDLQRHVNTSSTG